MDIHCETRRKLRVCAVDELRLDNSLLRSRLSELATENRKLRSWESVARQALVDLTNSVELTIEELRYVAGNINGCDAQGHLESLAKDLVRRLDNINEMVPCDSTPTGKVLHDKYERLEKAAYNALDMLITECDRCCRGSGREGYVRDMGQCWRKTIADNLANILAGK
jgi:hypothetical protein